jgi:hypothetical protein
LKIWRQNARNSQLIQNEVKSEVWCQVFKKFDVQIQNVCPRTSCLSLKEKNTNFVTEIEQLEASTSQKTVD